MNRKVASSQFGAAAVEFALVMVVFFTLFIGIIEMGRLVWAWNAASEATRLGARIAVVCDVGDTTVRDRMREMLPYLINSNVTVEYLNPPAAVNSCTDQTCKSVRVTLSGYTHQPIMLTPLSIPIPKFQTTLPREFMQSTGNPICG